MKFGRRGSDNFPATRRRPGCRERSRQRNVRRLRPSGFHPMSQAMRRAPAAHTLFVPRHPGYHGARSVNAASGVLRFASPPSKNGVTVAARRDAPGGVGTRNVPQDSPSPPARVEQGTMASKPARGAGRALRDAQEPMPQRSLNPAPEHPADFANLTPAGVPILAPSRFANPSPATPTPPSAAGMSADGKAEPSELLTIGLAGHCGGTEHRSELRDHEAGFTRERNELVRFVNAGWRNRIRTVWRVMIASVENFWRSVLDVSVIAGISTLNEVEPVSTVI